MEKIRLGKTEMMVSKLGFGGIPIQRVTEEEAIAVVRRCLEMGITFIDTANAYTTSEERIGHTLAGQPQKPIIATKSGHRERQGIERHLALSLERLRVDSIDLYQFHGVSDSRSLDMVLDTDGPMAAVKESKKAGKIKHIGITSHSMDTAKEAVKTDQFETIMFPFNFITYEAADELLPLCREHDVGFIAMKPLAGGLLDNVTIAFKYLFQFPDIVPIPGIEKPHEIEEIVQLLAGSWEMTESEEREMEQLREELGTRFCRRCEYCQPCPEEIRISTVMNIRSFAKRMPPQRIFTGVFAGVMDTAANCTECGDCEEKCPYHLPISEMITEQVEWYREEKRKYEELIASR